MVNLFLSFSRFSRRCLRILSLCVCACLSLSQCVFMSFSLCVISLRVCVCLFISQCVFMSVSLCVCLSLSLCVSVWECESVCLCSHPCLHGSQMLTLGVILLELSVLFFKIRLSLRPGTHWWRLEHWSFWIFLSLSPQWRGYSNAPPCSAFSMDSGDQNSGPHAYTGCAYWAIAPASTSLMF